MRATRCINRFQTSTHRVDPVCAAFDDFSDRSASQCIAQQIMLTGTNHNVNCINIRVGRKGVNRARDDCCPSEHGILLRQRSTRPHTLSSRNDECNFSGFGHDFGIHLGGPWHIWWDINSIVALRHD